MTATAFVTVGRVAKSHGLKGEVSVVPATEAPFSLLTGLEVWFAPPTSTFRSATILGVRQGPKGPLVRFSGLEDIQGAQSVVRCELLVRSDRLPSEWVEADAEPQDVIGYAVTDAQHGSLGCVVDVIITGANDVWVVTGDLGEVLIPVIDDVVVDVDDTLREIRVRLLDGLLP